MNCIPGLTGIAIGCMLAAGTMAGTTTGAAIGAAAGAASGMTAGATMGAAAGIASGAMMGAAAGIVAGEMGGATMGIASGIGSATADVSVSAEVSSIALAVDAGLALLLVALGGVERRGVERAGPMRLVSIDIAGEFLSAELACAASGAGVILVRSPVWLVLTVWGLETGIFSLGNMMGEVGFASAAKEFELGLRMVNRGIRVDDCPRGKAGNSVS
jgi:hypothetical protein